MCAFLAFSFVLNAQALIFQIQKQIEPGVRADDTASFYDDYVTCFFTWSVQYIIYSGWVHKPDNWGESKVYIKKRKSM